MSKKLPVVGGAPGRALSLDALRGLAILTMCLSGIVPYYGLPEWMYHAQFPYASDFPNWARPYDASYPGITWVDLVFPAFLFSMGVAFPFAMRSRLAKGASVASLIPGVFKRWFLILFFGIYVQNVTPGHIMQSPAFKSGDWSSNWVSTLSFIGFLLGSLVYWRLPKGWPQKAQYGVRIVGFFLTIGFLMYLRWPQAAMDSAGAGRQDINFDHLFYLIITKSDIIIVLLAHMALVGSLIWLFTRDNWFFRLMALPLFFAAWRSFHTESSVIRWIFSGTDSWPGAYIFHPLANAHLFSFDWLKYIFIVIPGTIVGDTLLAWMKGERAPQAALLFGEPSGIRPKKGKKKRAPGSPNRDTRRYKLIAWFYFGLVVFALVGLKVRWVYAAPLFLISATTVGLLFIRKPGNENERLIKSLFGWATFWLALGLFFEPIKGGIKKDPSDMSYYFITLGLSILLLLSLFILIDVFERNTRIFGGAWLRLLIANGQNPIIAYIGIRCLLAPAFSWTLFPAGLAPGPLEEGAASWISLGYLGDTWWQWLGDFENGIGATWSQIVSNLTLGIYTPTEWLAKTGAAWVGALIAVLKTILLGLVVAFLTKKKIFWRT